MKKTEDDRVTFQQLKTQGDFEIVQRPDTAGRRLYDILVVTNPATGVICNAVLDEHWAGGWNFERALRRLAHVDPSLPFASDIDALLARARGQPV